MNETLGTAESDPSNPLQLRFINLFAVMTLGALVLAMVAPYFRRLKANDRWLVMASLGTQATVQRKASQEVQPLYSFVSLVICVVNLKRGPRHRFRSVMTAVDLR